MSKEIQFTADTGQTTYANLTNSVGQWYNTVGAAFEAFNAANWTDYDLAATEFGSSGLYSADMPAVAAGTYYLQARVRAGGSPAQTDTLVATGDLEWNGSAVMPTVKLADTAHGGTTATITMERLIAASTTSNEPAFKLTGNGTAAGLKATGGGTGSGAEFASGFGGQAGLVASGASVGASFSGVNSHGMSLSGGTTGYGLAASGFAGDILGNLDGTVTGIAGVTFPSNFGSLSIDSSGRVRIQSGVTKNVAIADFQFVMVQSADHVSGATGLTVSAARSLDGGAFAACTNTPVEVGNGAYSIDLSAADLNATTVMLRFTATGADTRMIEIVTTP